MKASEERLRTALGDNDLISEEAKNRYAAHRLLMRTEGVMEAAIQEYCNVDLVLGQIAEWGNMVNTSITHHDHN